MKNIVYLATSIDGYIADLDGGIDWLSTVPNLTNDDLGWGEFISKIDALVMGKNTFLKVLSFGVEWPYPVPTYILSNSMQQVPQGYEDKVEIISGTPQEITDLLNKKGYENLYIDGGFTIQQFLQADLVDELIITKIPLILGKGIPLFTDSKQLVFEHVKTEVLIGELVQTAYRRKR